MVYIHFVHATGQNSASVHTVASEGDIVGGGGGGAKGDAPGRVWGMG